MEIWGVEQKKSKFFYGILLHYFVNQYKCNFVTPLQKKKKLRHYMFFFKIFVKIFFLHLKNIFITVLSSMLIVSTTLFTGGIVISPIEASSAGAGAI